MTIDGVTVIRSSAVPSPCSMSSMPRALDASSAANIFSVGLEATAGLDASAGLEAFVGGPSVGLEAVSVVCVTFSTTLWTDRTFG